MRWLGGINLLFARPTAFVFFPHGCDLSKIFRAALRGFTAADLASTSYDQTIWNSLPAMWAFEHVPKPRKWLAFVSTKNLVPCTNLTPYTRVFRS
jgi:hypothetical protein